MRRAWVGVGVTMIAAIVGCGSVATTVQGGSGPGGSTGTRIGGSEGGSAATGSTTSATGGAGNTGNTGTGTGGAGAGTTTIDPQSGLPCDVAAILTKYCTSCHASPPNSGATMPLLSYADLAGPSKSDPTQTWADRSLARMKDAASPMPPKPASPVSAAEIATFQAWVSAGLPQGACGEADAGAPDPVFAAPPGCDSGQVWTPPPGGDGAANMYPGRPCISCHQNPPPPWDEPGPPLAYAGTVFELGHTTDSCLPTATQAAQLNAAQVVIVDANGTSHYLPVDSNGNFFQDPVPWPKPYTAKVLYQGKERVMTGPQTSGDCNVCHTVTGTNGAPGRIALP